MKPVYIEAFHALELPVWATKIEVEAQQRNLVKAYKSVKDTNLQTEIEKVNAAANLLIKEYFISG